ncbi:MAG: lysophospholipid acyltransferase family protein [Betaproteobacteria bacterium]
MAGLRTPAARLAIALIEATARWQPRTRAALARAIGGLLWWLIVPRRRVTLANLQLCFPALTEAERRALGRRCFQHMARALLDHGALARLPAAELHKLVRFDRLALLADTSVRPLIIVAPHFAGLNAGAVVGSTALSVISIYARTRNPVWDAWLLAIRNRFHPHRLVAREGFDLRAVVRGLKEGLPLFYLPDQDPGERNGIFVPFFGVPTATLPMVSRLARLTGARVVLLVAEMTDNGYEVHLEGPWADFPGASVEDDTARINAEIERWARRLPEQYFWTHKRFKTRPAGERSPY